MTVASSMTVASMYLEPEAVRAWYVAHKALFVRPEQRLTHHILLTVNDDDRHAMYAQIKELLHTLTASREAFADLALRYSHCPSALEGGRLGWVSQGLLYPELDASLFLLECNALSEPLETELGWHVLWCEDIRPPEAMAEVDALQKAREYLQRSA